MAVAVPVVHVSESGRGTGRSIERASPPNRQTRVHTRWLQLDLQVLCLHCRSRCRYCNFLHRATQLTRRPAMPSSCCCVACSIPFILPLPCCLSQLHGAPLRSGITSVKAPAPPVLIVCHSLGERLLNFWSDFCQPARDVALGRRQKNEFCSLDSNPAAAGRPVASDMVRCKDRSLWIEGRPPLGSPRQVHYIQYTRRSLSGEGKHKHRFPSRQRNRTRVRRTIYACSTPPSSPSLRAGAGPTAALCWRAAATRPTASARATCVVPVARSALHLDRSIGVRLPDVRTVRTLQ